MAAVARLPLAAETFLDTRGDGRSLRVRWHHEAGLVLLSFWHGSVCTGTFRLSAEEAPALVEALSRGVPVVEEPLGEDDDWFL